MFLLLVGSVNSPGLLFSLLAIKRYGNLLREYNILRTSLKYKMAGWQEGLKSKITSKP